MLATQMVATHLAAITALRRLKGSENIAQQVVDGPKSLMDRTLPCGARTRSGHPCRTPPVRGRRRCRMHGGAAGSGAPVGNKNALRHGPQRLLLKGARWLH